MLSDDQIRSIMRTEAIKYASFLAEAAEEYRFTGRGISIDRETGERCAAEILRRQARTGLDTSWTLEEIEELRQRGFTTSMILYMLKLHRQSFTLFSDEERYDTASEAICAEIGPGSYSLAEIGQAEKALCRARAAVLANTKLRWSDKFDEDVSFLFDNQGQFRSTGLNDTASEFDEGNNQDQFVPDDTNCDAPVTDPAPSEISNCKGTNAESIDEAVQDSPDSIATASPPSLPAKRYTILDIADLRDGSMTPRRLYSRVAARA